MACESCWQTERGTRGAAMPGKKRWRGAVCRTTLVGCGLTLVLLIALAGCGLMPAAAAISAITVIPDASDAAAAPTFESEAADSPVVPSATRTPAPQGPTQPPTTPTRAPVSAVQDLSAQLTPAAGGTQTTAAATTATAGVSLDEKIGQMLLVGFRGLTLTADNPIVADLRQRHIGGVILFDYDMPSSSPVRNIQSPQQVQALTAALQREASTPLLIAIDQEGGQVDRLKEDGFPPTVSQQYLGTLNDLNTTRKYAESTAQTLSQLGININFAPDVDLNTNPDNPIIGKLERSFSADPTVVTNNALEVIKAHHEYGVLTTLKHFPGHGSSTTDSHLGFVDVTKSWSPTELVPYSRIIQAGQADTVMTAHIFNTNLDPDVPATLSKPTITGILRDKLHFNGVVFSDDLQMKAITDNYGFAMALESAIDAGVDVLTIGNNLEYYDATAPARAIDIIKELVQEGKISPARIDQSYQRIMHLKSGPPTDDIPESMSRLAALLTSLAFLTSRIYPRH